MASLSVFQKISQLFDSPELSDCKFLIGKEKRPFNGHKLVIASGSEFFESMFYGGLIEQDDKPIIIPESSLGFINVLKYLYDQETDFILEELYEIYLVADKYAVIGLIDKLEKFIEENADTENLCSIYEMIIKINKINSSFGEKFKKQSDSGIVFKSDRFCEINEETLISFLNFDQLMISEIDLLRACSKWIDYQLKKKSTKLTTFNKIRAFKSLKWYIKFSEIKIEDLKDFPEIAKLITHSEMGKIFFHSVDKSILLPFKCRTKRKAFRTYRWNNFHCFSFLKRTKIEATDRWLFFVGVNFRINNNVKITSIKTTCSKDIEMECISFSSQSLSKVHSEKTVCDNKWVFNFRNLEIIANENYTLKFDIRSQSFDTYQRQNYSLESQINDTVYKLDIFSGYQLFEKIEFFPWSK